MTDVVIAKDIWKSFRISSDLQVDAIRGLNVRIKKGEFVSIMGPSGSGKSTLLNLIGCLDAPSRGRLNVLKQETKKLDDRALTSMRADKIGFVFQSFNLLSSLSVIDNIELVMRLRKKAQGRSKRLSRARELLRTVGLEERAKQQISKLSGGEKQRVAIVRALANDPEIILADEPTGNLDSTTTKDIIRILHDINSKGTTVIMVTHNESTTDGTKVLELVDGRIKV